MATIITKSGQPKIGTTIECLTTDGEWTPAKIVGKFFGQDGHTLIGVALEWPDGAREIVERWAILNWRPVATK